MVDPIGVKAGTMVDVSALRSAGTAPATPVSPAPATASDTAQTQAGTLAATLASTAPVDANRVAEIRRAIANGTFPILPATIADQMLALRLEWNSNDAT